MVQLEMLDSRLLRNMHALKTWLMQDKLRNILGRLQTKILYEIVSVCFYSFSYNIFVCSLPRYYMKLFLFVSILFLSHASIFCQTYSERDVEICKSKFKLSESRNLKSKPIGNVIVSIGESFIGTDYKASTLEKEGGEELVVNLNGLDCTTFLENVLVFARLIKKDSTTFNNFLTDLTYIRYRHGIIKSYASRLHYFSDWIFDNIKKNVVEDITKDLGGEAVKFQLSYMSGHPAQYIHLKENPSDRKS